MIIFATGPTQRRPIRRFKSPIIDVTVSKNELECIHCQERMRFFNTHDFKNCFYSDFKCLDLLNAQKYIKGIDEVMKWQESEISSTQMV